MGSTTTFTHKPRIISFKLISGNGADRVFEAVNDRAKKRISKQFGKRKYATVAMLKQLRGYDNIRQYKDGKLTTVTL